MSYAEYKQDVMLMQCLQFTTLVTHIAPEEILGQKVVTIKDDCSIKSYGFCRYEKHKFQNTFHQPFKRYGNPDMQFLGTLKIFFQILNVFLVLLWNSTMIFIFKVAI